MMVTSGETPARKASTKEQTWCGVLCPLPPPSNLGPARKGELEPTEAGLGLQDRTSYEVWPGLIIMNWVMSGNREGLCAPV